VLLTGFLVEYVAWTVGLGGVLSAVSAAEKRQSPLRLSLCDEGGPGSRLPAGSGTILRTVGDRC